MKLEEINKNLKTGLSSFENIRFDVLTMNVDEISSLLRTIENFVVNTVEYSQKLNPNDSDNNLSERQLDFIKIFLQNLHQNFFPMAHTYQPLGNLKITVDTVPNEFQEMLLASISGISMARHMADDAFERLKRELENLDYVNQRIADFAREI